MKHSYRKQQLEREMLRKINEIVRFEMKDPGISRMVTITRVDVSKNLEDATAYVSVLGDDAVKAKSLKTLNKARGWIRKKIAHQIRTRLSPQLWFKLDRSIDNVFRVETIIQGLKGKSEDE